MATLLYGYFAEKALSILLYPYYRKDIEAPSSATQEQRQPLPYSTRFYERSPMQEWVMSPMSAKIVTQQTQAMCKNKCEVNMVLFLRDEPEPVLS